MTLDSRVKAAIATAVFALVGVYGVMHAPWHEGSFFAHSLGLYLLLLVHTFVSIRCFSALIDPKDKRQITIDVLLVGCYFGLGLSVAQEFFFWYWWCLLFALATLKYAMLVGRLPHPVLLRRKLMADVGGLFLAALYLSVMLGSSFVGAQVGAPQAGSLVLVLFTLATVYYLFVRPLYIPDTKV